MYNEEEELNKKEEEEDPIVLARNFLAGLDKKEEPIQAIPDAVDPSTMGYGDLFTRAVRRGWEDVISGYHGAYAIPKRLGVSAGIVSPESFEETRQNILARQKETEAKYGAAIPDFKTLTESEDLARDIPKFAIETVGSQLPVLADMATWAAAGAVAGQLATPFLPGIGAIGGGVLGGIGGFLRNRLKAKAAEHAMKDMVSAGISKELAEKASLKYAEKIADSRVAKELGAKLGMWQGAAKLEAGHNFAELMERGEDTAFGAVTSGLTGQAAGAVELLGGSARILDQVLRTPGTRQSFLKSLATNVGLRQVPEELLQETGQEVLSVFNLVLNDPSVSMTSKESLWRYINSAAVGALMGGVTGTASTVLEASMAKRDPHPVDILNKYKAEGSFSEHVSPVVKTFSKLDVNSPEFNSLPIVGTAVENVNPDTGQIERHISPEVVNISDDKGRFVGSGIVMQGLGGIKGLDVAIVPNKDLVSYAETEAKSKGDYKLGDAIASINKAPSMLTIRRPDGSFVIVLNEDLRNRDVAKSNLMMQELLSKQIMAISKGGVGDVISAFKSPEVIRESYKQSLDLTDQEIQSLKGIDLIQKVSDLGKDAFNSFIRKALQKRTPETERKLAVGKSVEPISDGDAHFIVSGNQIDLVFNFNNKNFRIPAVDVLLRSHPELSEYKLVLNDNVTASLIKETKTLEGENVVGSKIERIDPALLLKTIQRFGLINKLYDHALKYERHEAQYGRPPVGLAQPATEKSFERRKVIPLPKIEKDYDLQKHTRNLTKTSTPEEVETNYAIEYASVLENAFTEAKKSGRDFSSIAYEKLDNLFKAYEKRLADIEAGKVPASIHELQYLDYVVRQKKGVIPTSDTRLRQLVRDIAKERGFPSGIAVKEKDVEHETVVKKEEKVKETDAKERRLNRLNERIEKLEAERQKSLSIPRKTSQNKAERLLSEIEKLKEKKSLLEKEIATVKDKKVEDKEPKKSKEFFMAALPEERKLLEVKEGTIEATITKPSFIPNLKDPTKEYARVIFAAVEPTTTTNIYKYLSNVLDKSGFKVREAITIRHLRNLGPVFISILKKIDSKFLPNNELLIGVAGNIIEPDFNKHPTNAVLVSNNEATENADALLAVWDGKNRAIAHMIYTAYMKGLTVAVHSTKTDSFVEFDAVKEQLSNFGYKGKRVYVFPPNFKPAGREIATEKKTEPLVEKKTEPLVEKKTEPLVEKKPKVDSIKETEENIILSKLDKRTGLVNPLESPASVIIAGSRGASGNLVQLVSKAIEAAKFKIEKVISGNASGIDSAGNQWAEMNEKDLILYPADWNKHGKSAGFIRNKKMAENADALLAIWDGKSPGTAHMIYTAYMRGLTVAVYSTKADRIVSFEEVKKQLLNFEYQGEKVYTFPSNFKPAIREVATEKKTEPIVEKKPEPAVKKKEVEPTVKEEVYKEDECCVFWKTGELFGGLSNMASGFPIEINGVDIRTSEALYQAIKFPHLPSVQEKIINETSPLSAKKVSIENAHQVRKDLNDIKVELMYWALRIKLAQNFETFGKLLESTGNKPIVERSSKDAFWGAIKEGSILKGTNMLGKLLMKLRQEYYEKGTKLLRVEPLEIPNFLLFGRPIQVIDESKKEKAIVKKVKPIEEPTPVAEKEEKANKYEDTMYEERAADLKEVIRKIKEIKIDENNKDLVEKHTAFIRALNAFDKELNKVTYLDEDSLDTVLAKSKVTFEDEPIGKEIHLNLDIFKGVSGVPRELRRLIINFKDLTINYSFKTRTQLAKYKKESEIQDVLNKLSELRSILSKSLKAAEEGFKDVEGATFYDAKDVMVLSSLDNVKEQFTNEYRRISFFNKYLKNDSDIRYYLNRATQEINTALDKIQYAGGTHVVVGEIHSPEFSHPGYLIANIIGKNEYAFSALFLTPPKGKSLGEVSSSSLAAYESRITGGKYQVVYIGNNVYTIPSYLINLIRPFKVEGSRKKSFDKLIYGEEVKFIGSLQSLKKLRDFFLLNITDKSGVITRAIQHFDKARIELRGNNYYLTLEGIDKSVDFTEEVKRYVKDADKIDGAKLLNELLAAMSRELPSTNTMKLFEFITTGYRESDIGVIDEVKRAGIAISGYFSTLRPSSKMTVTKEPEPSLYSMNLLDHGLIPLDVSRYEAFERTLINHSPIIVWIGNRTELSSWIEGRVIVEARKKGSNSIFLRNPNPDLLRLVTLAKARINAETGEMDFDKTIGDSTKVMILDSENSSSITGKYVYEILFGSSAVSEVLYEDKKNKTKSLTIKGKNELIDSNIIDVNENKFHKDYKGYQTATTGISDIVRHNYATRLYEKFKTIVGLDVISNDNLEEVVYLIDNEEIKFPDNLRSVFPKIAEDSYVKSIVPKLIEVTTSTSLLNNYEFLTFEQLNVLAENDKDAKDDIERVNDLIDSSLYAVSSREFAVVPIKIIDEVAKSISYKFAVRNIAYGDSAHINTGKDLPTLSEINEELSMKATKLPTLEEINKEIFSKLTTPFDNEYEFVLDSLISALLIKHKDLSHVDAQRAMISDLGKILRYYRTLAVASLTTYKTHELMKRADISYFNAEIDRASNFLLFRTVLSHYKQYESVRVSARKFDEFNIGEHLLSVIKGGKLFNGYKDMEIASKVIGYLQETTVIKDIEAQIIEHAAGKRIREDEFGEEDTHETEEEVSISEDYVDEILDDMAFDPESDDEEKGGEIGITKSTNLGVARSITRLLKELQGLSEHLRISESLLKEVAELIRYDEIVEKDGTKRLPTEEEIAGKLEAYKDRVKKSIDYEETVAMFEFRDKEGKIHNELLGISGIYNEKLREKILKEIDTKGLSENEIEELIDEKAHEHLVKFKDELIKKGVIRKLGSDYYTPGVFAVHSLTTALRKMGLSESMIRKFAFDYLNSNYDLSDIGKLKGSILRASKVSDKHGYLDAMLNYLYLLPDADAKLMKELIHLANEHQRESENAFIKDRKSAVLPSNFEDVYRTYRFLKDKLKEEGDWYYGSYSHPIGEVTYIKEDTDREQRYDSWGFHSFEQFTKDLELYRFMLENYTREELEGLTENPAPSNFVKEFLELDDIFSEALEYFDKGSSFLLEDFIKANKAGIARVKTLHINNLLDNIQTGTIKKDTDAIPIDYKSKSVLKSVEADVKAFRDIDSNKRMSFNTYADRYLEHLENRYETDEGKKEFNELLDKMEKGLVKLGCDCENSSRCHCILAKEFMERLMFKRHVKNKDGVLFFVSDNELAATKGKRSQKDGLLSDYDVHQRLKWFEHIAKENNVPYKVITIHERTTTNDIAKAVLNSRFKDFLVVNFQRAISSSIEGHVGEDKARGFDRVLVVNDGIEKANLYLIRANKINSSEKKEAEKAFSIDDVVKELNSKKINAAQLLSYVISNESLYESVLMTVRAGVFTDFEKKIADFIYRNKFIMDYLSQINVRFENNPDPNYYGKLKNGVYTFNLARLSSSEYKSGKVLLAGISFLHEIVHSATQVAYVNDKYFRYKMDMLFNEAKRFANSAEGIDILESMKEKARFSVEKSLDNVQEFMTYLMTDANVREFFSHDYADYGYGEFNPNKEFVEYMTGTFRRLKTESIFKRFIDLLKDALHWFVDSLGYSTKDESLTTASLLEIITSISSIEKKVDTGKMEAFFTDSTFYQHAQALSDKPNVPGRKDNPTITKEYLSKVVTGNAGIKDFMKVASSIPKTLSNLMKVDTKSLTRLGRTFDTVLGVGRNNPSVRQAIMVAFGQESMQNNFIHKYESDPIDPGNTHPVFDLNKTEGRILDVMLHIGHLYGRILKRNELDDIANELGKYNKETLDKVYKAYSSWLFTNHRMLTDLLNKASEALLIPYRNEVWYDDLTGLTMDMLERKGMFIGKYDKEFHKTSIDNSYEHALYIKLLNDSDKTTKMEKEKEAMKQFSKIKSLAIELAFNYRQIEKIREDSKDGGVYYPIIRGRGSWIVTATVTDSEGNKVKTYHSNYKTKIGASIAASKLKKHKEYKDAEVRIEKEETTPEGRSIRTLMLELDAIMSDSVSKSKEKGHDELMAKTILHITKKASEYLYRKAPYSKGFKENLGRQVAGYSVGDPKKILGSYIRDVSGIFPRIQAAVSYSEIIKSEKNRIVKDYLIRFAESMTRDWTATERVFNFLRAVAFFMYLGFNIKSAFVQLVNVPILGFALGSLKIREVTGKKPKWFESERMFNIAASDILKYEKGALSSGLTNEELVMLSTASKDGHTEAMSLIYASGKYDFGLSGTVRSLSDMAGYMFGGAEKYVRKVAFLTGLRIGKKGGLKDKQLYDFAVDFLYNISLPIGKSNLPEELRKSNIFSSMGRVAYTFLTFPHGVLSNIWHLMKAREFHSVFKILSYTILIAGMTSVPFLDDLLVLYEKWTGNSIRMNAKKTMESIGGTYLSKFGLHGIPGLLNIDLSGSIYIGLPLVEFAYPRGFHTQNDPFEDIALGVYGNLLGKVSRAYAAFEKRDILSAIELLSPSAVENIIKARREFYYGATNYKGKPIKVLGSHDNYYPEGLETFFRNMSFQYISRSEVSRTKASLVNIETALGRKRKFIYDKIESGNFEQDEIANAIIDYNNKVIDSGLAGVVPLITKKSIRDSLADKVNKSWIYFTSDFYRGG